MSDDLIERLRKRAKEDRTCADNSAVIVEALAGQMKLFDDRDEQHPWNTYAVRMAVDHRNSVKRDTQYANDLTEAADFIASTQEEIARLREALEPLAAIAAAVFYIDEDGREMNSHRPDDLAVWGFDRVELTYGHLRAARSLLPSKPVAANPLPGGQG